MAHKEKAEVWAPLIFYSLLALGLSVLVLRFQYFIGDDGYFYARMGENIIAGRGLSADGTTPYLDHPPFYSFLIGIFDLFFKDLEFSGHLVSLLTFSLTVLPLFLVTKEIYSLSSAHWVCLLYATHGFLLIHSGLAMTESLFGFLTIAELYFLNRMIHNDSKPYRLGLLLGISGGLAYLTRPEGSLFYASGALAVLLFSNSTISKRRVFFSSLAAFLLCVLPYASFVFQKTGKLPISDGMKELFIIRQMDLSHPNRYIELKKNLHGLSADKTKIELYRLIEEEFDLWEYLSKDNFMLLRSFPSSLVNHIEGINRYFFGGLGFLFVGASWLGAPWDQRRKKSELVLLLFLATFIPLQLGTFMVRRYLVYLVILLIWMGNGIEIFRRWVERSFNTGSARSRTMAVSLCLIFAALSAAYLYRTITNFPMAFETKELGLWMKDHISEVEKGPVASRHPAISFYSGTKFLGLPYVDHFDDLSIYMKHYGAKYFVVSDDLEPPFDESYGPLLDETKPPPPGMIRRHVVLGRRKVFLYELTGTTK